MIRLGSSVTAVFALTVAFRGLCGMYLPTAYGAAYSASVLLSFGLANLVAHSIFDYYVIYHYVRRKI